MCQLCINLLLGLEQRVLSGCLEKLIVVVVLGFTRPGIVRAGQKCDAFALIDIAIDPHSLHAYFGKVSILVIRLLWGHSSLQDRQTS